MIRRGPQRIRCAAAAAILLAAGGRAPATEIPGREAPPSLVVVIVVDMLPSGKLESLRPLLSGGLRRMLDAGRVHASCAHAHASTLTAPGHASLLSGMLPSRHGVIMNEWYDRDAHRVVYCVEDPGAASPGADRPDRSPRNLLADGLADLIKDAHPQSLVYAVAAKDRSAILSAGHRPDGAFWFDDARGGFTGDPDAIARLGDWKHEFFARSPKTVPGALARVPESWTYPQRPEAHADDYPYETAPRAAPHDLGAGRGAGPEAARRRAKRIEHSPWMDRLTLDLAAQVLDDRRLGRDAAPDLLVVALGAADFVGHRHGPDSQEYLDAIIRLDGWLSDFIERSERAAAVHGGAVFALSSDHGVLPLPELHPGGRRVDGAAMIARLQSALTERLDPRSTTPFVEATQGGHVYLDRRALEAGGVPFDKAVEEARRILLGFREVARVYRAADLAPGEAGDVWLDLHRAAWHPQRGGDLVVQPCRGCLFTSRAEGTSHGTAYEYDRMVPLILMGRGVEPGSTDAACRTIDLAPTLAGVLGLSFATPRDGRALPLASGPR